MKALILTLTVGQGHNSAGRAVSGYLESQGVECTTLDTYKYLNRLVGDTLDKGYNSIARLTPELNLVLYDMAEKDAKEGHIKSFLPYTFAEISKNKMLKYIERQNPDVIICTHIFAAILITQLKKEGLCSVTRPVYGIVTDFTYHPFWEDTSMDYIVVPNEQMFMLARKRGIPEEKLLPFGIPVKEAFSDSIPKQQAREILGLEDRLTVLMLSGSMGFGNLSAMVKDLGNMERDLQAVVVCGRNHRLFKELVKSGFKHKIVVLEYIDNVETYMDAADFVVTKPGGITVSETLAKEKPLIVSDPLPGVENRNLFFLLNHSMAAYAGKYAGLDEALEQLLGNNGQLEAMNEAQKRFGKRHSAKALGDFIISHTK